MSLASEYQTFWTARNRRSFFIGIFLLTLALMVQVTAGRHSYRKAITASFENDLILDNIPTVNLDEVIVQGAILLAALTIFMIIRHPRYLLFSLKAVAIFIAIRSLFINLTPLGIYPEQAVFDQGFGSGLYNYLNFEGNYFFSGHTGLPFLMALIFWQKKWARNLFFGVSLLFAVSVLLAHVHYSIDVFAAPFISYGIFRIAKYLFHEDYLMIGISPLNEV